ncbi:hypothetical protein ACHAW6_006965 [Cyclotella cf. meneghiniana]
MTHNGAFSNDWKHHVQLLADILCHVHENSFIINTLNCNLAVTEKDWLCYRLTQLGLKPQKRK